MATTLVLAGALGSSAAGCMERNELGGGERPAPRRDPVLTAPVGPVRGGTAAPASARAMDADIQAFLDEHSREHAPLARDTVSFQVDRGVVHIQGVLSDRAQRDALVAWVEAVPGVRAIRLDRIVEQRQPSGPQ